MPKTKDEFAFALIRVDSARILQRPYFCKFKLPVATDTEILATYDLADLHDSEAMAERLQNLRCLEERIAKYIRRIRNHIITLDAFFSKSTTAEKESRARLLIQAYSEFEKMTEVLRTETNGCILAGEKVLDEQRKFEFAARLKLARQAAGLKQSDIALALNSSITRYSSYERGVTEPNIPTLIRICKLLNADANKLLGL